MSDKSVFTIGHSTHELDYFISLLQQFGVNCIIDVRSTPYSRMAPQYNQPGLKASLKQHSIVYMHLEKEFGARHTNPALLDEAGKVDFDKVRATDTFKQGLQRLKNGLDLGYQVALMCSEADPLDCHRFSMISYQLVKEGLSVKHILGDSQLVENSQLEDWLLQKYQKKLPAQSSFFETVTRESRLETAYRLRGQAVAYSPAAASAEEEEDSGLAI